MGKKKELQKEELKKVSGGGGCGKPKPVPKYNGHLVVCEDWAPSCNPRKVSPEDAFACYKCIHYVGCKEKEDFKKRFKGTVYTGYCDAQ